MIRLKGAHRGGRAVVIFGGPSLIEHQFDFAALQRNGSTIIVDTKALTPRLLASGLIPDYVLMLFPEKSKDNALQHYVFRSFLAGFDLKWFLKREHQPTLAEMRERFSEYFESWKPEKGPHKRYRWKPDVFLPDSPYALLSRVPGARLIANKTLLDHYFPSFAYRDRTYVVEQLPDPIDFTLDKYYTPIERDGCLYLRTFKGMLNAAAISLYPLLHYMGFEEVDCLGMDMSMLGSMEYAAPYTFKSMWHFRWFFSRTSHVFNGNYRPNHPYYLRPASEFADFRELVRESPIDRKSVV